ncbi:MAG: hypothetical protein ABIZ18_01015 [Caldimonas sp.]
MKMDRIADLAADEVAKVRAGVMHGPVLVPTRRDHTVASQRKVDDPLASSGF